MYQGLGQMLTMCLQHHQGCSETPKCAYVIYGQPLSLKQKIVGRKFCNMMINFGHSRSKFVFIGSVSRNMFSFSPCPRICSEIIGIFGGVGGLSLGER